MFQIGGDFWKDWNAALLPAVLRKQDRRRNSVYYGSWPLDGRWGRGAGRIYQTALGVLILTTYYRYDRGPKTRVVPFTGDLYAALAPYFAQLRDVKDARRRKIVVLKMVDVFGAELCGPLLRFVSNEKEKKALRHELAALLPLVAQSSNEGSLLKGLELKDGKVVEFVMRALSQVCSKRSVGTLCDHLGHGNVRVRIFAANALGALAEPEASGALSERLAKEKDRNCKAAISRALAQIAGRDSMTVVVQDALAQAGDGGARGYLEIRATLGVMEGEGLGERVLRCKERERAIYERCLAAIREHRAAALAPLLIVLLESEELGTRERALRLLRAVTGKNMGFDPKAELAKRVDGLGRWARWWNEHLEGYGGALGDKKGKKKRGRSRR